MEKVRSSMGERSRRWCHVTGSSENLLTGIPALRESVEEPRELSVEIQKLEILQVHHLAEARIPWPMTIGPDPTMRMEWTPGHPAESRGISSLSRTGAAGLSDRPSRSLGFKPGEKPVEETDPSLLLP